MFDFILVLYLNKLPRQFMVQNFFAVNAINPIIIEFTTPAGGL